MHPDPASWRRSSAWPSRFCVAVMGLLCGVQSARGWVAQAASKRFAAAFLRTFSGSQMRPFMAM